MNVADPVALINSLAPACKQHGIRRVRVGDIEIEFGPGGQVDETMMKKFHSMIEKGLPTDEEALFWSAPGGPERKPEPEKPNGGRNVE